MIGKWLGDRQTLIDKVPLTYRTRAERVVSYYLEFAELFGLRADLLWAQMLLETGGLSFPGQVKATQYNYAGLKTRMGDGFATFSHPRTGALAHAAHLCWYAYPDHVSVYCSSDYDPRHIGPHPNNVKVVGDLGNGRWTPNPDYAKNICRVWNEGV